MRRALTRHPNAVYFPAIALVTLAALAAGFATGRAHRGRGRAHRILVRHRAGERDRRQRRESARDNADAAAARAEDGVPGARHSARVAHGGRGADAHRERRAAREAVEHLEVQFLANRDLHLQFALLTDFLDAPSETMPDDAAILDAAAMGLPH